MFDVCEPFLTETCYLYDYGIDFEEIQLTLTLLDGALRTTFDAHIPVVCRDVLRAFVCNYIYISCNPSNNLPQGICKQDCIDYTIEGDCKGAFQELVSTSKLYGDGFAFIHNCDDPLWNIRIQNPELVNITMDPDSCISLSGKPCLRQVLRICMSSSIKLVFICYTAVHLQ